MLCGGSTGATKLGNSGLTKLCLYNYSRSCAVFTFVAAVEDVRESVGAFEVEKGGDGEDEEQAD